MENKIVRLVNNRGVVEQTIVSHNQRGGVTAHTVGENGMASKTRLTPKSDVEFAREARDIIQAFVDKGNEMLIKGLICTFQLTNGVDGKPVSVQGFQVIKRIVVEDAPQAANDGEANG